MIRVLQSFHSRAGKAYLFSDVVNVVFAAKEERSMTTGLHTVCDLHCNGCLQLVGWSYVSTRWSRHLPSASNHLLDVPVDALLNATCSTTYTLQITSPDHTAIAKLLLNGVISTLTMHTISLHGAVDLGRRAISEVQRRQINH